MGIRVSLDIEDRLVNLIDIFEGSPEIPLPDGFKLAFTVMTVSISLFCASTYGTIQ